MTRLSPHFDSREFLSRGQKPPDAWLYWMRKLCVDYLEPLRAEFGAVTIHSGYRSAKHNQDVGGAPSSYHQRLAGRRGAAADLSCKRGTPAEWARWLIAHDCPGVGLYPGHVHADNRAGRARW